MKKLILCVFITLNVITANAQLTKEILLKDVYKDAATLKLKDTVIEIPNKTKQEIKDLTKNFLSTAFHNLKEVLASETDDIIVINYVIVVNESISTLGIANNYKSIYNIRVELKFKDGKMKIEMYDAGNGTVISTSDSTILAKPNTYHLDNFFAKGVIKPIDMSKKKAGEFGYRTANKIFDEINLMYRNLTKAPFSTKANDW